nr:hypothetical protein [Tanacetum cinerariifolium]
MESLSTKLYKGSEEMWYMAICKMELLAQFLSVYGDVPKALERWHASDIKGGCTRYGSVLFIMLRNDTDSHAYGIRSNGQYLKRVYRYRLELYMQCFRYLGDATGYGITFLDCAALYLWGRLQKLCTEYNNQGLSKETQKALNQYSLIDTK